ncbi:dynein axonemal assembly factor 3-like [Eriocheir sinensis]|uniref:dynein axonemal assembly factor 3-like n=1 Tax=Eriocheir sinensis TaxID=95602 RepID=UPI0021C78064|nr:dynein axonemal assembly factor 3-like [Eriocheir sinensis]
MLGHGMFNWWGFSPPVDLLSCLKEGSTSGGDGGDGGEAGEVVQVAVVGAGDPRHLLLSLARKNTGRRLRVFILEAHVEVYARLLLLLGSSLQMGLGLRERATLLLDLWANLYLRPPSRAYLELMGRRMSMAMTDEALYPSLLGLVSASRLKYRERDAMDSIFRTWYTLMADQYNPSLSWEVRLRQLLGTRYDHRRAEADWAWHMRLAFRIQKLQTSEGTDKEGDENTFLSACWGQEFLSWREDGRALALGAEASPTLANTSLASVAVVVEGSKRHRRVGYWGDVLTGPFPALALASADPRAAKTQNGYSVHRGSEVALWNMESVLDELWNKYLEEEEEGDTVRENGATGHAQGTMDDRPGPEENVSAEELCGDVEKLHIQKSTEELTDGEEECNISPKEKDVEQGSTSADDLETKLLDGCEETEHRINEETKRNGTSGLEYGRKFTCSGRPTHPQFTHSSTASMDNYTTENEVKEALGQIAGSDSPSHTRLTHLPSASVDNRTTEQPDKEINDNTPAKEAPTHHVRKKSSVEGCRAYVDYLRLEGVEVILLSPSRLNDTSLLFEVDGELDLIYLSAAMAHLLSPSFFEKHRGAHTQLILETVQMFPQLTDDQVKQYQTRMTTAAAEAGWQRQEAPPRPLCHLRYSR